MPDQFITSLWNAAGRVGLGLLALLASILIASVVSKTLGRVALRSGSDREDVVLLLAQITRNTLVILGVVTALGTMGINVSALVAGLGLTGFALGFAFRDALSNVLAGAMILFYRPFHRHDRIKVADFEGTVCEINLRYTIIQHEDVQVLIPNSNLLTNPIIVWGVAAVDKPLPSTDVATGSPR